MQQNAEAGPSIQPPPTITYDAWQTTQSTGGTSGTVADANTNNKFTEEVAEEEGPVSNFYCSALLLVTDCSSGVRNLRPNAQAAGATRITSGCCGSG